MCLDLPSRGKFELLAEKGSISFPMVLPPVGGDWEAVYTSLFTTLAPRPSAGAKRSRAEIAAIVRPNGTHVTDRNLGRVRVCVGVLKKRYTY